MKRLSMPVMSFLDIFLPVSFVLVLFCLTPTGAVSNRYGNGNSTHLYKPHSKKFEGGRDTNVEITHLNALPPMNITRFDFWPNCTQSLYESTKPCGFAVRLLNIPKFKYENVSGGKCVYFSETQRTWARARDICDSHGRRLARVKTGDYNRHLLASQFGFKRDYWIGLNDIEEENAYRWSNESSNYTGPTLWHSDESGDTERGDCMILNKQGLWEDKNCTQHHPYICDDEAVFQNVTLSVPKQRYFGIGDQMLFRCDIETTTLTRMKMTLTNRNGAGPTIYGGIGGSIMIIPARELPLHDQDTGLICTYKRDWKPRCLVHCNYKFTVRADENMERFTFRCCGDGGCEETTWSFKSMVRSAGPVFIVPQAKQPAAGDKATLKLMNGDTYDDVIICLARMGKDNMSTGSVGVRKPEPRPHDPEYRADAITEDWSVSYRYGTNVLVEETGEKPADISVTKVTSAFDVFWGGYHINMTISLGPALGRLYKATILCRSDTDSLIRYPTGWQRPHALTNPINVTFLPETPELHIFWPGKKGDTYAGDTLRANCTAYVGSLRYPPTLHWFLKTSSRTEYVWNVRHGERPLGLQEWVSLRQVPDSKDCERGMIPWVPTGSCYAFQARLRTWQDSQTFCRQKLNYELAKIGDRKLFELLQAKADEEGFYIGLTGGETKGKYMWWDGTQANVSDWGAWYHPTEGGEKVREDSTNLNCVVLHGRGLEKVSCDSHRASICQSPEGTIASPLTFDPDRGILLTSVLSLTVKDFLHRSTLSCSPFDGWYHENIPLIERDKNVDSDVHSLRVIHGQLAPRLTFTDSLVNKTLSMEATCSAYVGVRGLMTITLAYPPGPLHREEHPRWTIGGARLGLVTVDSSPRVRVMSCVEETNEGNGTRHIVANMRIHLSPDFHRSILTCYSYDITAKHVNVISYLEKSQLQASHVIDFTNLSTTLGQVERLFHMKFGDDEYAWASTERIQDVLQHAWIGVPLAVIIVLICAKDSISQRCSRPKYDDDDGKEEEEEGGGGGEEGGREGEEEGGEEEGEEGGREEEEGKLVAGQVEGTSV